MDVPFNDNREAKRLGARWDREARLWYDPTPDAWETTKDMGASKATQAVL